MKATVKARRWGGRGGALVASLALALGAGRAQAQQSRLALFAGRAVDERGVGEAALTLAPSATWAGPRASFGLGGQLTLFRGQRLFGGAHAQGRGLLGDHEGVGAVVDGEGAAQLASTGYRSASVALQPQLRWGRGVWSLEAGPHVAVGAVQISGGQASPPTGFLFGGGPLAKVDTHTRIARGLRAAARTDGAVFGIAGTWRGVALDERRWNEWTGDAALVLGPAVLSTTAGVRSGDLRESWLIGRVAARLIPQASLIGELGRSPSSPLTDRAGGRYAALGLVFTTGPRAVR